MRPEDASVHPTWPEAVPNSSRPSCSGCHDNCDTCKIKDVPLSFKALHVTQGHFPPYQSFNCFSSNPFRVLHDIGKPIWSKSDLKTNACTYRIDLAFNVLPNCHTLQWYFSSKVQNSYAVLLRPNGESDTKEYKGLKAHTSNSIQLMPLHTGLH